MFLNPNNYTEYYVLGTYVIFQGLISQTTAHTRKLDIFKAYKAVFFK